MLKKAQIIKRLGLESGVSATGRWICDMFYIYKGQLCDKIIYDTYTLSPSCLGVRAYIYSVNLTPELKLECETRGRTAPNINNKLQYCRLSLWYNARRVYCKENSKLAQDLYTSMYQMYNEKHR